MYGFVICRQAAQRRLIWQAPPAPWAQHRVCVLSFLSIHIRDAFVLVAIVAESSDRRAAMHAGSLAKSCEDIERALRQRRGRSSWRGALARLFISTGYSAADGGREAPRARAIGQVFQQRRRNSAAVFTSHPSVRGAGFCGSMLDPHSREFLGHRGRRETPLIASCTERVSGVLTRPWLRWRRRCGPSFNSPRNWR